MATFTTKQISEALGISEETVRRWIRSGELVAESIGKSYRVQDEELKGFLNKKGVSYENSSLVKMALAGTVMATILPAITPVGVVGSVIGGIGAASLAMLNQKKKNTGTITNQGDVSITIESQNISITEDNVDAFIETLEQELEQLKKLKRAKELQNQINQIKQNLVDAERSK